jgi:GR25 family glycosyltransferase involved in LPS biosynthesis
VFDRIYVLNLAADTDKLATTTATLTAFGIDFERFDAVDGAAPEFDDEWQAYQESDLSLPQEHHLNEHLLESRGAWGYLKTMRALLAEAKEEGLSNVLVLEDDVLVHRDFSSLFARSWSEVPSNWKVVYLGSVQAAADRSERVSDHLYNPGAMANGSYAVAIDSSVFDHLIGVIDRLDMPFDSGALREIDVAHAAQVFAMDPPVIIADVSRSTIRDGRSLEAHADKHGWSLGDYTTKLT